MNDTYEAVRDQILIGMRAGAALTLDLRVPDALAELSFPSDVLLNLRVTQAVVKSMCLDNLLRLEDMIDLAGGDRAAYALTKRGRELPLLIGKPATNAANSRDERQQIVTARNQAKDDAGFKAIDDTDIGRMLAAGRHARGYTTGGR